MIGYGAIINHFGNGNPYKKDNAPKQKIMEDMLFVAKAYKPIFIVKNQWLRHLVMC